MAKAVRMINTKAHALFDYILGVVMIFSCFVFDFPAIGPQYIIALAVGLMMIVMACFTRFEYSAKKIISLRAHLIADIVLGIFLAISPWLFKFYEVVFKPHLVFGLALSAVGLLTDRMLFDEVKEAARL